MTGRLIRLTTALAVVAVAGVAAIISYQHAYELVRSHGDASLSQASIVPAQHCRATPRAGLEAGPDCGEC